MPPWLTRRHRDTEGIQPASRQGLSGRSARGIRSKAVSQQLRQNRGALSMVLNGPAPVSGTTGEPAPCASPQNLFGKARTYRAPLSSATCPFPSQETTNWGAVDPRGGESLQKIQTSPVLPGLKNLISCTALKDLRSVLYRLISSGLIASCLWATVEA